LGAPGASTLGLSVAVDTKLNVFVAGWTTGGLDGGTPTGAIELFVAKYDGNGVLQYTRQLGVAGATALGSSVTTDASGNVYVAGETTGGLDGNALIGGAGKSDSFVIKYSSDGVLQYTRQLGAPGADTYGRAVAVDSSGNVYVAGDTTGWLGANAQVGVSDYFVAKYNINGDLQYTNQFGAVGKSTFGNSLTVDAAGSVYLAGETSGKLYVDALTGTKDFFVAKFNGSGAKQYLHQLGVAGQPTGGQSVALDASGNVYVAGSTLGGLDGNVLASGLSYFFVTKYDSSGVKK
jgi:hypothetical protein